MIEVLTIFFASDQERLYKSKHTHVKRNYRFTTAHVDTDGKHRLFLHEQLTYLHTGNTQTKLQTLCPKKKLWKIITYADRKFQTNEIVLNKWRRATDTIHLLLLSDRHQTISDVTFHSV